MKFTRSDVQALLLPAIIALVIILGYFLLSGNWSNLGNPLASIIAPIGGVIGAAVGVWRDRRRMSRKEPAPVEAQRT